MACGAEFEASPREGSLPPGGAIAAKKFACQGCGALMLWDAEKRALECPFCGGTAAVERDEGYVAVENALEDVPEERRRSDAPKVFTCDRCGSSVRFEGATVSASCPFCGSEHVVERAGDAGRILPASAVPFHVSREAATAKWREWLGRGLFRPRGLRESATAEALKGVYLPFWTYDCRTYSRWTADAGHHYWVTVRVGNQTQRQMRTRWVPAAGQRNDVYDDVLVCASRGVDERTLEETYPYGLSACRPYRSEFLSGWAAEEYAVELKEGWDRARRKVNEEEERRCSRDVPGDTQRNLRVWTQHAGVTWKHLLLPLWIASYRYREKTYRFLVNGQTGKVAGTAPVSWVKVTVAVVLAAAVGVGIWWMVAHG
jgi:predicted RNA-binding Zn-ribbon protein involved in translation (DUF1610 family)